MIVVSIDGKIIDNSEHEILVAIDKNVAEEFVKGLKSFLEKRESKRIPDVSCIIDNIPEQSDTTKFENFFYKAEKIFKEKGAFDYEYRYKREETIKRK